MKCEQVKPLLTQYLLGDMDEYASAEIRKHLEKCEGCRTSLREIEPTLDLLRDALAAPSLAPKHLSAGQHAEITRKATSRGRKILRWFVVEHRTLTHVAALFVVGFILVSMFLPSLSSSRKCTLSQIEFVETVPVAPQTFHGRTDGKGGGGFGGMGGEMAGKGARFQIAEERKRTDLGDVNKISDESGLADTRPRIPPPGKSRGSEMLGAKSEEAALQVESLRREIESANRSFDAAKGERLGEVRRKAGAYESKKQLADGEGAATRGVGRVLSEPTAPMAAVSSIADPFAAAPASAAAPADPFAPPAPAAAQQPVSEEKYVELKVKLPKPGFIGSPASLKSVAEKSYAASDKLEARLNVDRQEVTKGDVASASQKPAPVPAEQQLTQLAAGVQIQSVDSIGKKEREYKKLDEKVLVGKEFGVSPEVSIPAPPQEFAKGNGVGGDMDKPIVPFAPVMTRSPVIMKGLYGNRNKPTFKPGEDNKSKSVEKSDDIEIKVTPVEEDKTGPRFKAVGVNPFVLVVEKPFSTFAIDVDTASYTLARNYMMKGQLPPAEAVRTEEFVNFFDYAYKAPDRETFKVYVECAPSKFGRGGLQMMKIGVKGRRLGREEQRRAVLTFLIDTSGSMEMPDRIVLVKKSLRMLVEKLNPQDLVSIVKYDSHARIVLEHVPAADKQRILEAIDNLQCSGSTNLEEGMERAYQIAARNFVSKGENRVLLMSDGVANLGDMAAKDILKKVEKYRKQGIFCSVFGFGMGTYDDEMLQDLANKGDGIYKFIDSETEARTVFVDDLSANLNTIAKDVKIQVEFNPKRVNRYRQIGYENRQLKKEDFRNDKIDAGEVGSGQSVTALYEMELGGVRIQNSEYRIQNTAAKMIYPDREPLATVRVRYQRVDNGAIEEIERPVTFNDMIHQFDQADVRFRLATCAAEFAEILRGSPFAEGREFQDVARVLAPIALELNLDGRVQELMKLVNGANGLSRGQ